MDMKTFKLISALLSLLVLPGCITLSSKDTHSCTPRLPHVATAFPRNITFSIRWRDNDGRSWYTHSYLKNAVRDYLKASRLFDQVEFVYYSSDYKEDHLAFTFEQSGAGPEQKQLCAALFLCCLPCMATLDLNASVSLLKNKKEFDSYHTRILAKEYTWPPLVVAMPFWGAQAQKKAALHEALDDLLRQIKENSH